MSKKRVEYDDVDTTDKKEQIPSINDITYDSNDDEERLDEAFTVQDNEEYTVEYFQNLTDIVNNIKEYCDKGSLPLCQNLNINNLSDFLDEVD